MAHAARHPPSAVLSRFVVVALAAAFISCATRSHQPVPASPAPVDTSAFAVAMASVAKAPWTEGNRIVTLNNGDGYFPVMLEAIADAKRSITFETFVYKQGLAGHSFSTALAEAARKGVKVHVILDAFGARYINEGNLRKMRESGVQLHWYSPWVWSRPLRYNHRTHRKIMVVDGAVAYTGGAGFTDRWLGDAHSPDHWRDTQYEIRGPVVRQIQEAFNKNWKELTGEELSGPDYFPSLRHHGDKRAHFSLGAPLEQEDTMGSSFLLAIKAAREEIILEQSYFIPTRELMQSLLDALERGVKVEILVPGEHTDMPICRDASRGDLLRLHRAGALIWEYQPTMMHGKLLVVDRYFSAVGSANFDPRSFFYNDEANLNVLHRGFSHEQIGMFVRDKERCKLLTGDDLRLRPHRIPAEGWARLVRGQL